MNTPPNPPHIGIVIVSFNTRTLIQLALASTAQTEESASYTTEIVVVDNASTDGSVEMLRRDYPQLTLIANTTNRGFAAATNQGIAAVQDRSDLVLLLNPDAQLCAGALIAMTAFMAAHPRVGVIGPRFLYPDGRPQEGAWHFPTLLMELFDLFPPRGPGLGRLYTSALNGRYAEERQDDPFPIDHPLGAAMLIRRTTIEAVGPFDEDYWMYAEEVDWCLRCHQAGWAIWQVPAARVIHAGGASARQIRVRSYVALHRSRLRFMHKWHDTQYMRWYTGILRVGMLWAMLKVWRDWLRGRQSRAELRSNLLAYGSVLALTQPPSSD